MIKRIAIVIVFVLALFALDLTARAWLVTHPTAGIIDLWAQHYAPSASAEREVRAVAADLVDGYWQLRDQQGQYINIAHGERATVGQPITALYTLYLMGNSEVLGIFVRDSETIASRLQALLPTYRVVNLGSNGQVITTQVAHLKALPLHWGDIVIFVDGSQDVLSIWNDAQRESHGGALCDLYEKRLAVAELLCRTAEVPPMLNDAAWVGGKIDSVIKDYRRALDSAVAFCRGKGAAFWHFKQPLLTSHPALYPGMAAVFAQAWPYMPGALLVVPEDTFIDFVHTDAAGNEIIAKAIFDQISIF